jgi:single-strand selective monofunctional uracil DNA glycosylase
MTTPTRTAAELIDAARDLSRAVSLLGFAPPVAFVYNPLEYAWDTHRQYLERYLTGPREAIFLGMNPGPFGMAQTGVPFGEVAAVRDWMGLDGSAIGRPVVECPSRPVTGFACPRAEVSGARLWGWARERFGEPGTFLRRFAVINYCPLVFMAEGGRNLTPDKLPAADRVPLEAACDEHLRRVAEALKPKLLVGVGGFARKRLESVFPGARVGEILHPSPASPKANRGWQAQAEAQLRELGVALQ